MATPIAYLVRVLAANDKIEVKYEAHRVNDKLDAKIMKDDLLGTLV